ncbi:MAG: xylulokinase, partial [Clostridia bacterium]|nr:xylulokinase [Clostridia bacterium]
HTRSNMIRAVMEGVTYSQTDCLEIIRGMGVKVEAVRASGGGAKSALWRQMLADCFDAEIRRLTASEGPALGVAILAGVGASVYRDVAEGCDAAVHDRDKLLPIAENVAQYRSRYALYQNLYKSLKQDFKTLASMQ